MNNHLDQARACLWLRKLFQQYGYQLPPNKSNNFSCPFCQKNSASLRKVNGREWFKCFNSDCPSATSNHKGSWDEVRFIAWKHNLSISDGGENRYSSAQIRYLKEAGVWKDYGATLAENEPNLSAERSNSAPNDSAADSAESTDEIEFLPDGNMQSKPQSGPQSPKQPETPIWQRLYELTTLIESDRVELREKRGFSHNLIERAGFRTNHRPNKEIIELLVKEYGPLECARVGLLKRGDKRDRHIRLRPTGQFYGWGVVGKKAKSAELPDGEDYDDLDTEDFEWATKESGRCNPYLIPYFDSEGNVIAMRPHKGFPKGQKPRLYVACTVTGARAVITEGEFKARAIEDVCTELSIAAIPGITQCKNLHVWADILDWLKRAAASEVIIAFDNEEKSDPELPGYKAQFEKRFEAQVWARVLASRLEEQGYRASIATLPNEWRENGKADWDSALARFRRLFPDDPDRITMEFEQVLVAALRRWEFKQARVFESDVESIIEDRAALFSYKPGLPNGGKAEQRLAKELRRLAIQLRDAKDLHGRPLDVSGKLTALAQAHEETWAWYYIKRIFAGTREKFESQRMDANGPDQRAAFDYLINGTPHPIAPFRLQPYYVLLKPDGTRDRLVRLVNDRNEDSGLVALPSVSLTAPRDWRQWLADRGNYGWEGGERELQALHRDINFKLARREVKQLVYYGCDRPDSPWFFGDVMIIDGLMIDPDEDGIFWHKRQGYTYRLNADKVPIGDENQSFRIPVKCQMNPGKGLQYDDEKQKFKLVKGGDDQKAVIRLTDELAAALQASFASSDGLLLLGAYLSSVAAPNIYAKRGEFPSVWIPGEKGSGKTVAAKVGMALWGFSQLDQPMSFKSSTTVNAIITLGQLANIPNWGDEYKEGSIKEEAIKNIIHSSFNREIPGKWSSDSTIRKVRTGFLVTGESTCDSAGTMDRYLVVPAAKEHWKGSVQQCNERFKWLLENRKHFFAITRALLLRHDEFVQILQSELDEWENLETLATAEPRGRFAHGVAYASLCALTRLIPFQSVEMLAKFKEIFIKRTLRASREVRQRVSVNQFLEIMVSAVKAGAFGHSRSELRKNFHVRKNPRPKQVASTEQARQAMENHRLAWESFWFDFTPSRVIDVIHSYCRACGKSFPLDQPDLLAQMRPRPYWVEPPAYGSMHKQRFAGKSSENCWCIDVDKLPELGYVEVSDEAWEASKYRDGKIAEGNLLPWDEWVDPRKGDLFYLIDLLLKPQEGK